MVFKGSIINIYKVHKFFREKNACRYNFSNWIKKKKLRDAFCDSFAPAKMASLQYAQSTCYKNSIISKAPMPNAKHAKQNH